MIDTKQKSIVIFAEVAWLEIEHIMMKKKRKIEP